MLQRYINTTEMDQTEWIDLHFLSYISLKSGLVGKYLQDRRLLLHLLVNKSIHRVAPGWRIFLPVKFTSRRNSLVVQICTKRFTPLEFINQLLQQIFHRRKEKAFSFHGVLAQFVHVAFKRVVTLSLGPSIVLTL